MRPPRHRVNGPRVQRPLADTDRAGPGTGRPYNKPHDKEGDNRDSRSACRPCRRRSIRRCDRARGIGPPATRTTLLATARAGATRWPKSGLTRASQAAGKPDGVIGDQDSPPGHATTAAPHRGVQGRNRPGKPPRSIILFVFNGLLRAIWRREGDSNPRGAFTPTRFPGARLKPLGHPSQRRYHPITPVDPCRMATVSEHPEQRNAWNVSVSATRETAIAVQQPAAVTGPVLRRITGRLPVFIDKAYRTDQVRSAETMARPSRINR